MIRMLSIAAVAACGLALPAFAEETAQGSSVPTVAAFTQQLAAHANANHVRRMLAAKGYSQVSDLNRTADGRWTGTAIKDGKLVYLAVILPSARTDATQTN